MFDVFGLTDYYLYDFPFLIIFALICFYYIKDKSRQLFFIYLPLFLLIVLVIHWSIWGIGPAYSLRIQINSVILDAISHGLPFIAIFLIFKRFGKKKSKLLINSFVSMFFFILAIIIIQIIVFFVSWLLYL